jgi:hypothetical protein
VRASALTASRHRVSLSNHVDELHLPVRKRRAKRHEVITDPRGELPVEDLVDPIQLPGIDDLVEESKYGLFVG